MNRCSWVASAAAVLSAACLLLAAGCGSGAANNGAASNAAATVPLATSFASGTGSGWTVVEMGGSAAKKNNFWQLFVRPSATAPWRLATPAGVADNGGLVVASPGGESLVTGFRPSQDLTFSPVTASADNGANWSPTAPLNPGLASAPDALAAGPGGQVIALTSGGGVQLGTGLGSSWSRLSTTAQMATTAAAARCGLASLTAAAITSSGTLMLGGSCTVAGTAGIFARSAGGHWQAAGPALPRSLAHADIDVLRLAVTGTGVVALLRAGSGASTSIMTAFQPDNGPGQWTVSAPLHTGTRELLSTTLGPGSAVGITLSDGRGVTLASPGASWQTLPALPRYTATLALGPAGQVDAIGAHFGTFTDWRLEADPAGWRTSQTISVSIPYGSSG